MAKCSVQDNIYKCNQTQLYCSRHLNFFFFQIVTHTNNSSKQMQDLALPLLYATTIKPHILILHSVIYLLIGNNRMNFNLCSERLIKKIFQVNPHFHVQFSGYVRIETPLPSYFFIRWLQFQPPIISFISHISILQLLQNKILKLISCPIHQSIYKKHHACKMIGIMQLLIFNKPKMVNTHSYQGSLSFN